MKLLLSADWHLSDNPRDAYRFGAAELVLRVAKEKGADHLFILGDFTENRDHHSAAFVNRAVALMTKFVDAGIRVVIVRGNHDSADPSMPFFRFINAIPDCFFIVEPEVWTLDLLEVALVPHGMWPSFEAHQPYCDLILTHQTFAGAEAENGISLRGLRLPMDHNVPIYSGDVHVPQDQGQVTYVGPPTLMRFGDAFQPRVILLDGHNATSISLRTPTKRLIDAYANPAGEIAWPADPAVHAGDILKVRVYFDGTPLPPLSHVRANVTSIADRLGATIYSIIPMLDYHKGKGNPIPVAPVSRSDADLVRQYAASQSLEPPALEVGLRIVGGEVP